MSAPRATMRLQLHRDFTFADATQLVPYLARLGISHLYASPILTARPGSTHGYDVTDPTRVNPELGGEMGLRRLVAALRAAGLGLIVDIVPNHMAAGGLENPWWGDVLRHGRDSRYARFFDIDWDRGDRLLAPFLGEPYGVSLREGAITLAHDGDEPVIRYYDSCYPLRPADLAEVVAAGSDAFDPATGEGRERLHDLLERQHYRLAWWRSAGDAINWRRFFDINSLAALRIEDDAVFEATHSTILRLYKDGLIDGVRIDHVDGLADPAGYCRRLRAQLDELAALRPVGAPQGPAWLIVEKILGVGESLPEDWSADGTSGYDFMDAASALLHDAAGESALQRLWNALIPDANGFAEVEAAARRDVLERAFTAQLEAVVEALHCIALRQVETRDITRAAIRRVLVALLARFPVYRSYGIAQPSEPLAAAAASAAQDIMAADRTTLALVERWLGEDATPDAALRFQKLSAPLAAKAVEDTAYYRYGVLLSRNEVGADVRRFSTTVAQFHAACLERRQRYPDTMLATATHDHKRGEDVRARLAVLSEIPEEWARTVQHWFNLNAAHRRYGDGPMPSPADELMLYQMIVGAWPLDVVDLPDYTDRLAGWQLKALREAKLVTDWAAPNLEYEDAARSILYTIMTDDQFVAEAAAFARRIGPAGAVNGLTQTLLKLTVPGVPDFYQGSEFWDQSLVDPDNRRPVDFAPRIAALESDAAPVVLAAHWRDGRVKQAVIRRALALRHQAPELFARGEYRPLEVTGSLAEHVVAFVRSHGDTHCIVVAPRLIACHCEGRGDDAIPTVIWQDTLLHLPADLRVRHMRDRLTDRQLPPLTHRVPLSAILTQFPIALLATA